MGAVNGNNIHPCQHLIEAFPIGCFKLFFNIVRQLVAIVIMNGKTKSLGAPSDSLTNTAHTNNTKALAPDAVA